MNLHLYPLLITSLASLVYLWTFIMCARARTKYKIMAPAVTGNLEFEKRFRIQQNTMEQLILFLPSLWVFSLTVSQVWGAVLGAFFIAGRIIYVIGYARDPEKRHLGGMIGGIPTLILAVGGLVGVLWIMITGHMLFEVFVGSAP